MMLVATVIATERLRGGRPAERFRAGVALGAFHTLAIPANLMESGEVIQVG
jgi:hypothetical protein